MRYIDADQLKDGIKHLQKKFPVATYEALYLLIDSMPEEHPDELEEAHQENMRFLEEVHAPKIKGWVARDKDGTLCLYGEKPKKVEPSKTWGGAVIFVHYCRDLFPDLTWEDGPIEVELTIHRV